MRPPNPADYLHLFQGQPLQDSPFAFKTVHQKVGLGDNLRLFACGTTIANACFRNKLLTIVAADMKNQDEDVQFRGSLETLARQVSENWRQQIRTLQATLDQQISSIEAALDEADYKRVIDASLKEVAHTATERAELARQKAEASAAQALAAIEVELRARLSSEIGVSTSLRTALGEAKKELESAQNRASRAEAAQRATAAQHRQTLDEQEKHTMALDSAQAQLLELQLQLKSARREADNNSVTLNASQQLVQELSGERDELLERIRNVTAAKAALEGQYRQLESVSQKLSGALSQMLRERDPARSAAAGLTVPEVVSSHNSEIAKPAPLKAAPARISLPANTAPAAPAAPQKKPLQFAGKARDARRVRIRRGIDVSVDGIPGELVDLSIGGAQAILRQAVRPNQLVRLVLLTAAGQVICKGRIVWVVFEQPDTSLSVYRTGVKFADVDHAAVENFMNDFCDKPPIQSRHSSDVA